MLRILAPTAPVDSMPPEELQQFQPTADAAPQAAEEAPVSTHQSLPERAVNSLGGTSGLNSSRGVGARRVVPLPRTLPELKQEATMNFGAHGRLHLRHQGREIHHPECVKGIRHMDVVHAEFASRDVVEPQPKWQSTQKADFVKPQWQAPEVPVMDDFASALTEVTKGAKFDSTGSRYTTDFLGMPGEPKGSRMEGIDIFSTHIPMGSDNTPRGTTYRSHYPWKYEDAVKRPPDNHSVLTAAVKGQPLGGVSNHTHSYTPRVYGADPPPKATCDDSYSTLSLISQGKPFTGCSVYKDNFSQPTEDGRQPSARPKRTLQPHRAFGGVSEYRRRYPDVHRHRDLILLERVA